MSSFCLDYDSGISQGIFNSGLVDVINMSITDKTHDKPYILEFISNYN